MRASLWAAAVTTALVPSLDLSLRNQSPNPDFERWRDWAAMRSAVIARIAIAGNSFFIHRLPSRRRPVVGGGVDHESVVSVSTGLRSKADFDQKLKKPPHDHRCFPPPPTQADCQGEKSPISPFRTPPLLRGYRKSKNRTLRLDCGGGRNRGRDRGGREIA